MPPNSSDVVRYAAPRNLKLIALIALAVAAAVVVVQVVSRSRGDAGVRKWTAAQTLPTVTLVTAQADTASSALTLPAQLQAYESAGIHSRVSGYLKDWKVDIGAEVKQGQLLAEVDTPDLDQQLAQARADLATAKANQVLSQSTEVRWKNLLAKDAVSQQEYDEKAGDLAAKISVVNAQQANVSRLMATSAFKRIVAPFDGVVTTRSTDIGQLISAGNPAEPPLFTVAQVDKLRVYVQVPQSYVAQIHPGMTAKLMAPERPRENFTATVVGDAQAIQQQSGTLLVQMQIDNRAHKLKAGGYAQASLDLAATTRVARIPASALINDEHGVHVAVLGPDGKVAMRPVTVARDLGQTLDISAGIAPGDRVIDSPPDDLSAGDQVRIAGHDSDGKAGRAGQWLRIPVACALAGTLILAGCSLAPAYAPPAVEAPTAFKEGGAMTPPAADGVAARRDWWVLYGDPQLDGLEADLAKANNSLASAVARYDQSRALAAQAGAALIPEIDAVGAVQANRQSKNRPLRLPAGSGLNNYDNEQLGAAVNYELDLWGRIRNIAASRDQAQASAADLRGVELSLQAQLADDYMALRGADAQLRLLIDTVDAYTRAYDLTRTRHQGGAASGLDEGRAQTQLRTAKALIPDLKAQRALYEHAIAALVGKPASAFSIPAIKAAPAPPKTPVTAPSALLQRRADVAAAERRAAAANAQIGVAKAAYFPTITLGLSAGFQDAGGVNLLQAPNSYWTLGPTLVAPLFDGGRRKAQTRFAEAQFAQAAADYKQTVLGAFQNVEDQLALNNQLADEADEQALAVAAAVKTQDLALTRYQLGAADYLEVTTAQTAALLIQELALSVQTRRLQASVDLVRALGGGWSRDQLGKL